MVAKDSRELPAGLAGGYHIVHDEHVCRVDGTANHESLLQVAPARPRTRGRLIGGCALPVHIPNQRYVNVPAQHPADFSGLVEAAVTVAKPVQRHGQQCVDGLRKVVEGWQQQFGEGRCIPQSSPELVLPNRRVERELIREGYGDCVERHGAALAIGTDHTGRERSGQYLRAAPALVMCPGQIRIAPGANQFLAAAAHQAAERAPCRYYRVANRARCVAERPQCRQQQVTSKHGGIVANAYLTASVESG